MNAIMNIREIAVKTLKKPIYKTTLCTDLRMFVKM